MYNYKCTKVKLYIRKSSTDSSFLIATVKVKAVKINYLYTKQFFQPILTDNFFDTSQFKSSNEAVRFSRLFSIVAFYVRRVLKNFTTEE